MFVWCPRALKLAWTSSPHELSALLCLAWDGVGHVPGSLHCCWVPQEVGLGSVLPNLGTVISCLGRGTSTLETLSSAKSAEYCSHTPPLSDSDLSQQNI